MSDEMTELHYRLYTGLSVRTRRELRIAHTLHNQDGYHILDLGITGATLEDAIAQMMAFLPTLAPETVLPHAPKAMWDEFLAAENECHQKIPTKLGKRGVIGVFVRKSK